MKAKYKIDKEIVITGIICVTALELYALSQGFNGWILTAVIGIIAAAIGVAIPKKSIIK